MKDKRFVMAGIVILSIAMTFMLTQNHPLTKKTKMNPANKAEEGALYSKSQIDALIKEQLSKKDADPKEKNQRPENTSIPSRKLKTGIAVFVKKEEVVKPQSNVETKNKHLGIATGSKLKAHLANAIFSFNVTSPVVAVVDEDFVKDDEVVVAKGTQFIGDAAVQKSRDRINVRFSVMVTPDGKETRVSAMALSLDGSGGIKGKVDRQSDKSMFKSIGETLLAGSAIVLGNRGGAMSLNDELRLNTARNLSDDARDSLNQIKIEESVSVEAYTPILVLFLDPL